MADAKLDETLRRLKEERDEADRRYNDALTALDKSFKPAPSFPAPPPEYDERQITPLNDAWNVLPAPPAARGLTRRLTGFIWRTVGPFLQRQLTFNSLLVDHLNRNVAAHREAQRSLEETLRALKTHAAVQHEFHSRLLLLLQQITGYVDTKDRDTGSGVLVVNASLSAMADHLTRRWEFLSTQFETRAAELAAEHRDARMLVGIAQQAAATLKREMERVEPKTFRSGVRTVHEQSPASGEGRELHGALDAYKYLGFEDLFRGSRDAIRERFESYVPYFDGTGEVLDIGCGRGEFLDLLKSTGIAARGVDVNHEMVEQCRANGLDAVRADAVSYLEKLPDASLGGIFSAQVVEHLEPTYLLRLLDVAFHKIAPGGRIVLETLNPACWVAFFDSYLRDITHRWPLHPDTLKYLVMASGFNSATLEWRSPVPREHRLQPIRIAENADSVSAEFAQAFNDAVAKLNARLFTYLDYAVVGQKGQRAAEG